MSKKIFAVNISLPGDDDEYIEFKSDRSLLDADIIVFQTHISSLFPSNKNHDGKPLLSTTQSFRLTEYLSHWRSELEAALSGGKTVFFFLTRLETFYIQSEQQLMTVGNLKKEVNNYSVLPISIGKITAKSGKEIRVARDLGALTNYWRYFNGYSEYEVCIEDNPGTTYFTTKTGNKAVGAVIHVADGRLILLPKLKIELDNLLVEDEDGEEYWNDEGMQLGRQLLSTLVEIDKAFQNKSDTTPAPEWTNDQQYKLEAELKIEANIMQINLDLEKLTAEKNRLSLELLQETQIRGLLYEKGHALEVAIMDALSLMGFQVEQFKNSESEFDIVLISSEGRFIGEVEGKDSRAINIDKLSQLEREIQEDFAREEVNEYAKGILFGNAYRLIPISERSDFFTDKCISGAKRSGIALIRTIDLFPIAKHLKVNSDDEYANACRKAIAETRGAVVVFPEIPKH
jgi:hypothetical protein